MIEFIEADYQAGHLQNIKSGQLPCRYINKLLISVISQTDINKVGLIERINFQDKQYNSVRYIIKDHQGQVLLIKDYSSSDALDHSLDKV